MFYGVRVPWGLAQRKESCLDVSNRFFQIFLNKKVCITHDPKMVIYLLPCVSPQRDEPQAENLNIATNQT